MLIFAAAVGVAWVARGALPARPRAAVRVRWVWMPIVAAALQIGLALSGPHAPEGNGHFAVVALSYAIVGAWLIGNTWTQAPPLRLPAGLVAGGWVLNVIPILANRGMPVSAAALARIGVHRSSVGQGNLSKHVLANSHTIAPWLGDVVPLPLPLLRNVISVGDIVVVVGAMLAVQVIDITSRAQRPEATPDFVVHGTIPT
jgi:Family of unknown function (DUF5317)